jgi:hypothetical protein
MTFFRIPLRWLLLAVAVVAVGLFLWNGLGDAHPAAVRNQYLADEITLEEAVEEVGDQAYEWVEWKRQRKEWAKQEEQWKKDHAAPPNPAP